MPGGKPPYYKNNDQLKRAIYKYFRYATKKEKPFQVIDLALFLGFKDKQSLIDYAKRNEEYSFTIKKAKSRIESDKLYRLNTNKGNVTGIIFDMKNNYDYSDKQDINVTEESMDAKIMRLRQNEENK